MSFVPDTQNKEFQDALNLIQYTRQSVFLTGNSITDTVNAYFGSYGNIATRTLLIVVTCEDNSKYGIVVSSN